MKAPPIRTWSEPIDATTVAGIATCYVVRHGCVYGLGVFAIVNVEGGDRQVDRWMAKSQAKTAATERLALVVDRDHGGRLPYVGRLVDIGGAGVDLQW